MPVSGVRVCVHACISTSVWMCIYICLWAYQCPYQYDGVCYFGSYSLRPPFQ
uniref:Uncharacterized protein n=1 Tax=Anguilla anguilla TaxID=7936 RepID=A0A0E9U0X1_ANGAN